MPSRIVCFVCGSLGGEFQLHSRPREGCAFFPFLEHHDPPKGSRIPGPDGIVDSCRVCYAFLTQQWESYERANTPAIKRLYWLKRLDDGQFTGAEMKLQGEYMAQVMGLQYQPSCGDSCAPLSPDSRDGSGVGVDSDYRTNRKAAHQDDADRVLDLSVPYKAEPSTKTPSKAGEKSGREVANSKPNLDDFNFVCYTCGTDCEGVASKFISSMPHTASEPFFPFLSKLKPPKGAVPLNSQGVCQVCDRCFSSLCHQWLSYEHHGTPNSARIYKVNSSFFSNDSNIAVGTGPDSLSCTGEVCYLCGKSWSSSKICSLFTAPVNGRNDQMYFPFIRELRRPHGARPLNPDGSVQVCVSCFGNLQAQWQHYETEKVPFLQRRYSLLPPSSSSSSVAAPTKCIPSTDQDIKYDVSKLEGLPKSLTQPLAIDINKSPSTKNHGLTPSSVTPNHSLQVASTSGTNNTPAAAQDLPSRHYSTESRHHSGTVLSIPHPLQQASERPKKVCFLCGEKCLLSKAQVLHSYPARHEAKSAGGQSSTTPFFPFLANQAPAPASEQMTDEGTVITCSYCYYSLLNQWRDFEESKGITDRNRWLRKYTLNEFVCFVCGKMVPRKKMRSLEVQKFLFLREHKAPPNALVMWGGEGVGACGSCHFSLTHQYTEFERLGLPVELRKYNWTVQHHTEENSSDAHDSSQDLSTNMINEDSNLSIAEATDDSNHGFMPSGKAQLSLSKLKSGTMPSRNQSSPSNCHTSIGNSTLLNTSRASSFAAALRNLAHQVKDPQDELPEHRASPPASQSSRSSTPKRSQASLMLPSHLSTSSFTSPPALTTVTAPLTALFNGNSDAKEGTDRIPSLQYSSAYEHWSKPEQEQRPMSNESRDDKGSVGKDGHHSRASNSVTPQRPLSSSSLPLTTQALSMYARNFPTYRPEDEEALRLSLSMPFGVDPSAYAAAAYHPALLQQQAAFAAGSLRMNDNLLLDQYRLLQSPYLPYSPAGLLSPHGVGLGVPSMLAPSPQYAPALLHPHHPYFNPNQHLLDAQLVAQAAMLDRNRLEVEKQREKRERDQEHEQTSQTDSQSRHGKKDYQGRTTDESVREPGERRDILNIPTCLPSHMSAASVQAPRESHSSHQHNHSRASPIHSTSGTHRQSFKSSGTDVDTSTPLSPWNAHLRGFKASDSHSTKSSYEKDSTATNSRDRHSNIHPDEVHHLSPASLSLSILNHEKGQELTHSTQPLKSSIPNANPEKNRDLGALFRPFDENTPSLKTEHASDRGQTHFSHHFGTKEWPHSHSSAISVFQPLELKLTNSVNFSGDPNTVPFKLAEDSCGRTKSEHFSDSSENTLLSANSKLPSRKITPPTNTVNERIERFDFKSLARECTSSSAHSQNTADVTSSFLSPKKFISKLDHAAVKAKERRQRGEETDSDIEKDEDERMLARLTMIGRATPLPVETPEAKMNLMEYLGITTWTKRRELERKKEKRRRRQLRLASLSPIQHELSADEQTALKHQLSPNEDPASCNTPNNSETDQNQKSEFINRLGLIPLTDRQRAELRNNRVHVTESRWRKDSEGQVGVKRKHGEMEARLQCGENSDAISAQDRAHPLHHSATHHPQHSEGRRQISVSASGSNRSRTFPEEDSPYTSLHNQDFLSIPRFHHNPAFAGHHFPGFDYRMLSSISPAVSGPAGLNMPFDLNRYHAWPGIEAVLESYHRHREEQVAETHALQERCRQLHAEREELEQQSQRVSRQMADLLEEKQRMEEERTHYQNAICGLKGSLYNFR